MNSRFGLHARAILIPILLGTLASCGGGNSGGTVNQTAEGYTVDSGVVQKGPLVQGSSVTINELNPTTLQPNGKSYAFETMNNLGTFVPTGITFTSTYLETTGQGYYFNELTGQNSSDIVFLRGLSNLATGNDKAVNVNVLSGFTRSRIKHYVTTTPVQSFTNARLSAQRELLAAFYIYNAVDLLPGGATQPAVFTEMDLSKQRAADQILAAISGMVMQIGQSGSGVNSFLTQVEVDLGDDGYYYMYAPVYPTWRMRVEVIL